jgi:hypothetical protein
MLSFRAQREILGQQAHRKISPGVYPEALEGVEMTTSLVNALLGRLLTVYAVGSVRTVNPRTLLERPEGFGGLTTDCSLPTAYSLLLRAIRTW